MIVLALDVCFFTLQMVGMFDAETFDKSYFIKTLHLLDTYNFYRNLHTGIKNLIKTNVFFRNNIINESISS